ncbi:hypothetical protein [Streptomyces sp. NPDC004330]
MIHAPQAPCCHYEGLPTRSEALIHLAMSGLMARCLTSTNTVF